MKRKEITKNIESILRDEVKLKGNFSKLLKKSETFV